MLSISDPMRGAGSGDYYLHLAAEDFDFSEKSGVWFGEGAKRLHLSGTVKAEPLKNLLDGLSPDGKRALVGNARDPQRQSAWDLTFSAPKSVSVLWALAPEDIRLKIEQAHHAAVVKSLAFVEGCAGYSRRGSGGEEVKPADLTFALFEHRTSRAQDPQLHTHSLMINLGVREDGSTGTIIALGAFRAKMVAGALYQAELALHLRQQLSLAIEADRVGFHISGVPKPLCEKFSQRRQVLVRELNRRGVHSAIAAKIAAFVTRKTKETFPREVLFQHWKSVADQHGWSEAQARRLLSQPIPRSASPEKFAEQLRIQVEALPPEDRTSPRILRLAAKAAFEHGVGADGLLAGLHAVPSPRPRRGLQIHWQRPFDRTPWKPVQRTVLHVEWEACFPNAPWKPAQKVKLPKLIVALPSLRRAPRHRPSWGGIRWKRDTVMGELRLQKTYLFPKAPKWSPLYHRSVPAFHWSARKSEFRSKQQWTQNEASHSH